MHLPVGKTKTVFYYNNKIALNDTKCLKIKQIISVQSEYTDATKQSSKKPPVVRKSTGPEGCPSFQSETCGYEE